MNWIKWQIATLALLFLPGATEVGVELMQLTPREGSIICSELTILNYYKGPTNNNNALSHPDLEPEIVLTS